MLISITKYFMLPYHFMLIKLIKRDERKLRRRNEGWNIKLKFLGN